MGVMKAAPVVLLAFVLLFAGCAAKVGPVAPDAPGAMVPGPRLGLDVVPKFSLPKIIDTVRSGGEPVIAVTPKGTIMVSSHPGYTHFHPSVGSPTGPELAYPTQAQSYMWRSTDGGDSFNVVSLLPIANPPNAGPRGVGQGVSDPDFAVDSNGRIYFTDLEGLAMASVSWSDDDGASWLMGDNLASGGPIDRQWLTTYGTTVWFRGNYMATRQDVRVSMDGAKTWDDIGDARCGGDIIANPLNGHLYTGCPDGMTVSVDGGTTWEERAAGVRGAGPIETEPAIDAMGNVYRAFDPARKDVVLLSTADEGATWSEPLSLKPFFPDLQEGTFIWPWTSAGSAGRVAVTFFASPTPNATRAPDAKWFVYSAIVRGADTVNPTIYPIQVTPTPFHVGPMCQSGTTCQATTVVSANSDRRLGDFFETTIDHEGFLHIVYADTQAKATDSVAHVGYVRLLDGPRLVEGPMPPGFPTQG